MSRLAWHILHRSHRSIHVNDTGFDVYQGLAINFEVDDVGLFQTT